MVDFLELEALLNLKQHISLQKGVNIERIQAESI